MIYFRGKFDLFCLKRVYSIENMMPSAFHAHLHCHYRDFDNVKIEIFFTKNNTVNTVFLQKFEYTFI